MQAAVRQKGNIFEVKFRKFITHMDYQEAIWSVVHFMCKIVWKILHDGVRYDKRGPGVEAHNAHRRNLKMVRHLRAVGYSVLSPIAQTPA